MGSDNKRFYKIGLLNNISDFIIYKTANHDEFETTVKNNFIFYK